MKKIVYIALNDLRVIFADPSNIFGLFGLPLILTFILGVAGGTGGEITTLRVDWIDHDNSPQSQALLQDLRANNPNLVFCPMDASESVSCGLSEGETLTLERAKERVQEADSNALVGVPKGFGASIDALQPVQITYASLADLTTGDPILTSLEAQVQRLNTATVSARVGVSVGQSFPSGSIFNDEADQTAFGQSVAEKAQAYQATPLVSVAYSTSQANPNGDPNQLGFGQSIPGMGSMFVMFAVFGCIPILIRERAQWTLQRLVVLPLRRSQILGGKVLAYFSMGIIQYTIVFAMAVFTGTRLGTDPLALALVMGSFTFCVTGLGLFLATILRTQQQADGVTLLLSMTLAPLGGAWWPLEIVPHWMQLVGRISPVSWAMEGYRSLIFFNGNVTTILPYVAVLLVMGAGLFALGVRGFSYE